MTQEKANKIEKETNEKVKDIDRFLEMMQFSHNSDFIPNEEVMNIMIKTAKETK